MLRRSLPLTPPWARALGVAALGLFLSMWAWLPMLTSYPKTAIEDGHYFHHQLEIGKAIVLRYHELPLWNPFDCRGIPMWDHPENITASPIFWLTLPLSATVTMIVWNLFHLTVGFCGMWLLARHELKLGRTATLVAAVFWTFGAGHTSQYAGEHEALISFLNAPLLLFLWRRAEHEWRYAVGCGLALAWMVYDGATYPLPFTVVMLGLETLLRVWPPKRGLRVAGAALVVGLVAFTVAACRILPIMDQFAAHKRVFEDDVDQMLDWELLRDIYTLRTPLWRSHFHAGHQYVFGEYISYIGWIGVGLWFLGMFASATDAAWLLGLFTLTFILMLGHFAPWSPWTWLHAHMFPFKSMRVAARFRLLLMMPIALWIGFATEKVPAAVRKLSHRWGDATRVVVVALAFLAAGDMVGLGREILAFRFQDAAAKPVVASTRFYYGGPGLADMIDEPRQNRAYLGCRAAWVYNADAAVWTGDVPQARPVGDGVIVEVANRTYDTFTIDVDVKQPSRVLVNSAYDQGWQSSVGTVVDDKHQLAVDLPVGRYRFTMRYWPKKLTLGFTISALGILGVAAFFLRDRRRRGPAVS
jgi:hypothetical protein